MKKQVKKARKKNNSLTKKEIEYYFNLYNGVLSREKLKEWGKKRVKDFEDEWFGRGSFAMPADSKDCPGCWNLRERCTCYGAPKVQTRQQKAQRDVMIRTSDRDFSINKYRKYTKISLP